MNIVAYEENQRNRKHVKAFSRRGYKVLEINTAKVTYHNMPSHALSSFYRRKLENLIKGYFVVDSDQPIKVIYT